ncbi:MAG: DUF349 domain-containing protein [Bacteroidales bacterium]|nr:DUF349 domain-containing protein [Bacteroidales bacterium]
MEETNTQQTTPEAMENEPIVEVQHTEEQTENVTETPVAAEPVVETPAAAEPAQQPAADEVKDEEPKAEEPEVDYSGKSREELVSALEELLNEDIQVVRTRAAAIRNRFNELNREVQRQAYEAFLSEGGNKDEYEDRPDSVAEAFHSLYERYRARRQQYLEAVEQQKQKNYEAKQALIEELRQLVDSGEESMKTVMDNFNGIQDRWKAIGEVPREKMNDLWQNYHFQIEQFFNKLKINRELRALDQKRNLELKLQLCEQAEELIVEPNIQRAAKVLQELRARWKEIGPVPNEQNEEIWQRFTTAANQIDERRREYYDQRKGELESNLLAKQALVDKAAELTATVPQSTKEWNDLTTALDELLKVWKTIGPVPREQNEEIWARFKGMIDKHYEDKKEYFGAIRDEQNTNYQKKVDLCLKAEAIAKREDWKKATEELLQLQKEWKEIGATSRKVSEKVWQRFRGACDEFFAKKGEFFKERRSSESENLAQKEAILKELKEHQFGDNRDENLSVIKDFQRRWAEVGFVPMADKERLHKEFRAEIDGIFEKLKISAREAEETAFRERLHAAGAGASRMMATEKQELQDKIEKLRSDLNTWENNLGFFANSKQADLLKAEFEKKMQGARQQLALMQAKLRILVEAEKEEKDKKAENAE